MAKIFTKETHMGSYFSHSLVTWSIFICSVLLCRAATQHMPRTLHDRLTKLHYSNPHSDRGYIDYKSHRKSHVIVQKTKLMEHLKFQGNDVKFLYSAWHSNNANDQPAIMTVWRTPYKPHAMAALRM